MRFIDHFSAGGTGGLPPAPTSGRKGDVFDPNNGGVQAQVALGDAAVLERAVQAAAAAQPASARQTASTLAHILFINALR